MLGPGFEPLTIEVQCQNPNALTARPNRSQLNVGDQQHILKSLQEGMKSTKMTQNSLKSAILSLWHMMPSNKSN